MVNEESHLIALSLEEIETLIFTLSANLAFKSFLSSPEMDTRLKKITEKLRNKENSIKGE
jgi:hypothetical protein